MKAANNWFLMSITAFAVTFAVQASSLAADKDNNPPGPAGGAGSNWENRPGPQGGPGSSPDRRPIYRNHGDNDNNPPGPAGGQGTNWEKNDRPRGWEQGKKEGWDGQKLPPGQYRKNDHPKPNIDFNHDGTVDANEKAQAYEKYIAPNREKREHRQEMKEEWKENKAEWKEKKEEWKTKKEAWKENKAEWKEEHPRLHRDRDNNPPGPAGGKGTNWENPRGPKGGPGASPNRNKK